MEMASANPWALIKHRWEGLDTQKSTLNAQEDKIIKMERKVRLTQATHGAHVGVSVVGFSVGGALLIGAIISFVAAPIFVAIAVLVAALVCLIPACAVLADAEIHFKNRTKNGIEITTLKARHALELTEHKTQRGELKGHIVDQEATDNTAKVAKTTQITEVLAPQQVVPQVEEEQEQIPGEDCITLQTMERATIKTEMTRLSNILSYNSNIRSLTDDIDCMHCTSLTFSIIGYIAGGILLIAAIICLAVAPFLVALPVLIAAMITIAGSTVLMGDLSVKYKLQYSSPTSGPFVTTPQDAYTECRNADSSLTTRMIETRRIQKNLDDAEWNLRDVAQKQAAYTALMTAQTED